MSRPGTPPRLRLCAHLVLAGLLAGGAAPRAEGRDLTLALPLADLVAPWTAVFAKPFTAATGIAASTAVWSGASASLQQEIKAPENSYDLVMVNSEALAAGCAGGIFEKLDFAQIGGRDHYLPIAVSDCGVGAAIDNLVLAWDRDKLQGALTWADFWDITKFPAKRGLRKGVRGNLEIALMADGVAPGDVYKVLATNDGVDRAFRKLDQLRPYIVWWDTAQDAARILGSGDVLMTSAPSATVVALSRATHRSLGIQWTDSLYDVLSWAVVKGSPNQREATQFLYFSGTPAIESRLLSAAGENGLAKGANEGIAPDLAAISPTNPANTQSALRVDAAFWAANLGKLQQRFEQWLAQAH